VRSEQAMKQEHHTLNSRMLKQAEGSRKTFKNLCQQAFVCRTDTLAAIEQWQEKQATLAVEATVLDVPVYEGKGRPGKNQHPFAPIMKSAVTYTRGWKSVIKPRNNWTCLFWRRMILAAH
jgi:hypothetical protein